VERRPSTRRKSSPSTPSDRALPRPPASSRRPLPAATPPPSLQPSDSTVCLSPCIPLIDVLDERLLHRPSESKGVTSALIFALLLLNSPPQACLGATSRRSVPR